MVEEAAEAEAAEQKEEEKNFDKEENQRKVFDFLRGKYQSAQPFTLDELAKETNWTRKTAETYWSKQYKDFATKGKDGNLTVSRTFKAYSKWERFKNHVTQKRRVTTNYQVNSFGAVLIFEFFLPLTHESLLRTLLDELFYRDTLLNLLKPIGLEALTAKFPRAKDESDETYFTRLCDWVAVRFGGYSIYHVNGRFRAGSLKTIPEAGEALANYERYLVDETTAVVRFIFPCGTSKERNINIASGKATLPDELFSAEDRKKFEAEAATARWFFEALFVQSILAAVNGEDEVWVVESGMFNGLHVWKGIAES